MIPSSTDRNTALLAQRMKQAALCCDGETLVALAKEIAASATRIDMAEAARRLIGLTQKAIPDRAQEVAQILVQAGTPAFRPYLVLVAALDAAAPHEPGASRFIANRRQASSILQAALVAVPDADAMSQKLRIRLARILWQMGDEEGMSELVNDVAARTKRGILDHAEVAKLTLMCIDTKYRSVLREAGRIALEQDPGSLEVLRAHVRGLIAERHAIDEWWPQLKQAAADHSDDTKLKRFIAFCAFQVGDWAFAEELLRALAHESQDPVDWEKAGLAALHIDREEQATEWLHRARPRVPIQQVGPLAPLLESLLRALNLDYHFSDHCDHRKLKMELSISLARLRQDLPATDHSPDDLLRAATAIGTVERYPFYVLSQVISQEMYVEHWDARYGTFDLPAYGLVWRALVEHQAFLLEHSLQRMLNGTPPGMINTLRETAALLVEAQLALDEPDSAIRNVQSLISAGCNTLFFEELLDRCLLHRSHIGNVCARLERRPTMHRYHATAYAVAQAAEWMERERLVPRALWEEGPFESHFEKADRTGQTEVYGHRLSPFRLNAMEASSLTLAASEILIGPHGTILRPSHWHYRGLFPQRTGIAISAAVGGAVLDLSGPTRRIDEPVIILACNDAVHVTNYFHWVNFVLTRCVFLLERGLLNTRRLLMPLELRPWMWEALELVGLSGDRLLSYAAHEILHIKEATVISAFDYPGAQYLQQFRKFLWNMAGATPTSNSIVSSGHIFMARPNDARRPFFGRERVLRIAQEEEFRCIDPSELSFADQIRLFARAKSVAGFGGAAFTNMAFCRPGMPALELTRRETTWPDYTGIALALGIKYRFCPGWIEPSAIGTPHVHDGPTRFDEAMVQRELNRLKTAAA